MEDAASEDESDIAVAPAKRGMEFVDMGGGDDEAFDIPDFDVPPTEISRFPFHDVTNAMALCLQQHDIAALSSKTRRSQADLDDSYTVLSPQTDDIS